MTGATSITQFVYWLRLQNAGRKELFLDHIEADQSNRGRRGVRQGVARLLDGREPGNLRLMASILQAPFQPRRGARAGSRSSSAKAT